MYFKIVHCCKVLCHCVPFSDFVYFSREEKVFFSSLTPLLSLYAMEQKLNFIQNQTLDNFLNWCLHLTNESSEIYGQTIDLLRVIMPVKS